MPQLTELFGNVLRSSCYLYSGALLLELKDGELYDHCLRSHKQPAGTSQGAGGAATATYDDGDAHYDDDVDDGGGWGDMGGDSDGEARGGDIDLPDAFGDPVGEIHDPNVGEPAAGVAAHGMMDQDMQQAGDDAIGGFTNGEDMTNGEAGGFGHDVQQQQQQGDASRGQRRQQQRGGQVPDYFDPYKPLDPHDKGTLLIKPLQVNKSKKN